VHVLLLILSMLQNAQLPSTSAPPAIRGDRFQLIVPQGWRTLNDGGFVLLAHSSGASLLVERISKTANLAEYAERQAERVMAPLGFAKLGAPQGFKSDHDEWVQYEIRGNRLSEPRRLLFRAFRKDSNFFEFVYEAPEDHFDALLTEAQGIVTSVQATIEAPPPRRPRR
jgi:hypothetical protein